MVASIKRADVATLIQEEYAPQVIKLATQASSVLSAFPTINMGTKVTHQPILASLPEADWVGDVTNLDVKTTSFQKWDNKTLVAEEIAVIIPIHENTLADATENLLEDISANAGQAFGKTLDRAVMFGAGKPASWTSPDLMSAAVASGAVKNVTGGHANADDIYGAGLQVAGMLADLGFDPTVALAKRGLCYQFANLRDANGNLALEGENIRGFDTTWNRNGAWDAAEAIQLLVDPTLVRVGIRQDIQVKFLTEATLGSGSSQINLAERDMVALRFKARFGYVLGNPVTPESGERHYGVGAVLPEITEP
ncbi:MAG: phage major capsid protein [Cellulomonadaceae bacterium]|jgi:HK97 family phage major capsid protein|nr:phage major capsid protein [Cellulomonadaceae bacterium]